MQSDDKKSGPDGLAACASVSDLGKRLSLSAEVTSTLSQAKTIRVGVQQLLDKGHEREAIKVLAHMLPARRAVWWAVLSAWHGVDGKPTPAQDRALASAVRWVLEPTETNRGEAEQAAGVACGDNAAGCCAYAAGHSGALEPSRSQLVPQEPLSAAAMVAHAISFAISERQTTGLPASGRQLVEVGIELFDKDVP